MTWLILEDNINLWYHIRISSSWDIFSYVLRRRWSWSQYMYFFTLRNPRTQGQSSGNGSLFISNTVLYTHAFLHMLTRTYVLSSVRHSYLHKWKLKGQCLSRPLRPQSEKLVPISRFVTVVAIGLLNPMLRLNQAQNFYCSMMFMDLL